LPLREREKTSDYKGPTASEGMAKPISIGTGEGEVLSVESGKASCWEGGRVAELGHIEDRRR